MTNTKPGQSPGGPPSGGRWTPRAKKKKAGSDTAPHPTSAGERTKKTCTGCGQAGHKNPGNPLCKLHNPSLKPAPVSKDAGGGAEKKRKTPAIEEAPAGPEGTGDDGKGTRKDGKPKRDKENKAVKGQGDEKKGEKKEKKRGRREGGEEGAEEGRQGEGEGESIRERKRIKKQEKEKGKEQEEKKGLQAQAQPCPATKEHKTKAGASGGGAGAAEEKEENLTERQKQRRARAQRKKRQAEQHERRQVWASGPERATPAPGSAPQHAARDACAEQFVREALADAAAAGGEAADGEGLLDLLELVLVERFESKDDRDLTRARVLFTLNQKSKSDRSADSQTCGKIWSALNTAMAKRREVRKKEWEESNKSKKSRKRERRKEKSAVTPPSKA